MKEKDKVIEVLEQAGFETTVLGHAPGKCERCGAIAPELAYGGCFPCGMWENPDSDDSELKSGADSALSMGLTFDMWIAGRKQWGKLVPSDEQQTRIRVAISEYIRDTLQPWIDSHTTAGTASKEDAVADT